MCYDFHVNLQEYLKLVNPSGVLPYDSLWREGRLEAGNGNADEELDAEAGGQSESDAAASVRARAHSFSRSRSRTESSAGSSASPALSAVQMPALLHVQSPAFDSVPSHLVTFFVSNLCASLPLLEPYYYSIMGEERCACYCTVLLMLSFCVFIYIKYNIHTLMPPIPDLCRGGISPSYLYRHLSELYDPEDHELVKPQQSPLVPTSN